MIRKELIDAGIKDLETVSGTVTEIERYAIHDGPGIRTVVFLKGCPLRCKWCSNPETQRVYTEMAFFEDKCIGCNRCLTTCPYNALTLAEGKIVRNSSLCRENCYGKLDKFPCTQQCYPKAMIEIGEKKTVAEVYKEVIRDGSYYSLTGGGITISGGEPTFQPEFLYSLLRYCKENWIDTAIETCGAGEIEDYERILPYLDVLFIDLKHVDGEKYSKWTNHNNVKVLEVIKTLSKLTSKYPFKMYIRVPVIPGFNDTEKEIYNIGVFVRDNCSGISGMELLPYHKLGRGKYKSLDREYELNNLVSPSEEYMDKFNKILLDLGINMYQF